jgi:uncharacterized membrane protein
MTDFFVEYYWAGPLLWALLYVSDYTMTLTCARLYQAGAREKIAFEGSYEITPFYQNDIDSLRRVSPRFVLVLGLGIVMFALSARDSAESSPGLFSFVLGALILLQLMVHIRHVRNYVLFRAMATDGVRGRIEYARPQMLKASSVEIAMFAVMFAVAFAFTGSGFVLGGAFGCTVVSIQHWYLMRRAADTSASARDVATAD